MGQIKKVISLLVIAVLAIAASASVTLRHCDTAQKVIDVVTDGNASHLLFFYDSLDVSSMRVYNTLTSLKTQKKHVVEVLDIRNTQTGWLMSTFEVFYVPTLRLVKWTASGRKILDGTQGMDFSPMSLAQFLDRY
ncbi:LP7 protein [Leptomonas pyrrhocoris]|uniref:LP7 protein n=1 Tax=Leptomonas pyrrhocoris TaxID=157538 RepID=A0A0M9FUA1_LEPPY|nr:LP7 protein [Leptomonas pyrrhocoris]XP_015654519.1 LP7 protein [Leptomonas pyrrhocoris]XP_015654520.1 LP7 protein [Leptomonas pyrrhocoris]KPA76079.1 LP7 protein [Leptomonas pyrrhocoris]KPA76080.1 LP7 protein [Leptomonas pyrrhocoris]KPA76081.1 LP7 protein [Leptomonas pyrrhocoris]|eukprot:XP_015654518.1 LP7 protein [Leptomonas pyrrhocoris]